MMGYPRKHNTPHVSRGLSQAFIKFVQNFYRDRKAETRNSLKPNAMDGSFERPGTPWESNIKPLSHLRPLSTTSFSVQGETAFDEVRAKVLCRVRYLFGFTMGTLRTAVA